MPAALRFLVLVLCLQVAELSEPCIIELECEECLPDNMPLVQGHAAGAGGAVRAAHGEQVALACGGGAFLAYPLRAALAARCEAGRYRLLHDHSLRPLLDLGCQENVFEDVLHQVEHCGPPLQGRAYSVQDGGAVRHLATLCFDADRALPLAARAAAGRPLPLAPHSHAATPLSLLGNFNHMFDARTRRDAERLYSDDARLNRRLHELFKHARYTFAGQKLTSGKLLSGSYFDEQAVRVAEFVSNRVAVWRSVAEGNLLLLQRDVAAYMKRDRALELDVYAGTHGVFSLNAATPRPEVYLKSGNRFPVPKYIWTVLVERKANAGVALVLLNDPFVTVSEIREAVFCESTCAAVSWLHELKRHRNYERPVNGLVFCCNLRDFADVVREMPKVFNSTIGQLN